MDSAQILQSYLNRTCKTYNLDHDIEVCLESRSRLDCGNQNFVGLARVTCDDTPLVIHKATPTIFIGGESRITFGRVVIKKGSISEAKNDDGFYYQFIYFTSSEDVLSYTQPFRFSSMENHKYPIVITVRNTDSSFPTIIFGNEWESIINNRKVTELQANLDYYHSLMLKLFCDNNDIEPHMLKLSDNSYEDQRSIISQLYYKELENRKKAVPVFESVHGSLSSQILDKLVEGKKTIETKIDQIMELITSKLHLNDCTNNNELNLNEFTTNTEVGLETSSSKETYDDTAAMENVLNLENQSSELVNCPLCNKNLNFMTEEQRNRHVEYHFYTFG